VESYTATKVVSRLTWIDPVPSTPQKAWAGRDSMEPDRKGGVGFDHRRKGINLAYNFALPRNRQSDKDAAQAAAKLARRQNELKRQGKVVEDFESIDEMRGTSYARPSKNFFRGPTAPSRPREKTEREKERELKSQAERLYEDDDVLVIRPKSHAASCYYGANTKWCTTNKGDSGYFEKYIRTGLLYYFIKKKENNKMALYRNTEDKKTEVYNAQDRLVSLEDLREQFPNQNDLIDELIGSGEFIKTLRAFTRGKVDSRVLEDSDDAILTVKLSDPLGQSTIVIDFDDCSINYYDSLADKPTKRTLEDIRKLIMTFQPDCYFKLKVNSTKDQSDASKNCGWFVCHFIIKMLKGKSFADASLYSKVKNGEDFINRWKKSFV